MVVLVLENASNSLRGELTKWFIEVKPGVLVSNVTKTVRDLLWEKVKDENISALMLYNYTNEQGYKIEMLGEPYRSVIDIDGIFLIAKSRKYEDG